MKRLGLRGWNRQGCLAIPPRHNNFGVALFSTKRLQVFTDDSFRVSFWQKLLEERFEKKRNKEQNTNAKHWTKSLVFPSEKAISGNEQCQTVLPRALETLLMFETNTTIDKGLPWSWFLILSVYPIGALVLLPLTSSLALIGVLFRAPLRERLVSPVLMSGVIFGVSLMMLLGKIGQVCSLKPQRQVDAEKLSRLVSLYWTEFSVPELLSLAKLLEMYYAPRSLTEDIYRCALRKEDPLWTPILLVETAIFYPTDIAITRKDLILAIELMTSHPHGLPCYSEYLQVAKSNLHMIDKQLEVEL